MQDGHMEILNRVDEQDLLRARIESKRAEFLVVYGRRRVGKTELLSHLASHHRSFYFEATETVSAHHKADLTAELASVSNDPVLAEQTLESWPAVLAAIERYVSDQPTLVVLDEFQYLAKQSPELETTLSRWWRTKGRHLPITLVVAGSEIAFFEDEILAGQQYG